VEESVQHILGTYDLPVSLIVDSDCIGAVEQVTIGAAIGKIYLPLAYWADGVKDSADNPPELVTPNVISDILPGLPPETKLALVNLGRDDDAEDLSEPLVWGSPFEFNDIEKRFSVYIERVGLSFVASRKRSADKLANDLAEGIDSWFETVATWVRVVSDQDVNLELLGSVSWPARGLKIQTTSGKEVGASHKIKPRIKIRFPSGQQALDIHQWQYVLARAGDHDKPPIEYLFAVDARTASRLHQSRRAVVDAATSVELSLNRVFDDSLRALPNPIRGVIRSERRTLGAILNVLAKADKLPAGLTQREIMNNVIEIRNKAMHTGYTPTGDEAKTAARLAIKIASAVVPLPA
jgi:hypothetical protein